MPNEKIGANLFMCIPPDHMRDDLPTAVTVRDLYCVEAYPFDFSTPVYVGVTDDMGNTVTLPCFAAEFADGRVVVMAHRTGRLEA